MESRHPPPLTHSDVREIIKEALEEWPHVSIEVHTGHHEWVEAKIKKENRQADMYWSITKAAAQWSVVGILGTLWVWLKTNWKFL